MTIDEKLTSLPLPMTPFQLYRILDELTADCDAYDFIGDRGARKARECWIASRFLVAHSKKTGRQYEATCLETDAPDIQYRDVVRPDTVLSIEAAELVSPNEKRNQEYLQEKRKREAYEREGKPYTSSITHLPQELLDAEEQAFFGVASHVLEDKLGNDYGSNCTLVMYVNLWLFDQKPIQKFVETYMFQKPIRFDEVWFLYDTETIIPLRMREQALLAPRRGSA